MAAARSRDDQRPDPGRPGGGGRYPGVVRLIDASAGNEQVRPGSERIADEEFHLADLVAAKRRPREIVALDQQATDADRTREPGRLDKGRRKGPERDAGERRDRRPQSPTVAVHAARPPSES